MIECATEADFYAHWREVTRGAADPVALAAAGGAAADRLSWVFLSGYQAAVRHCFPEFPVNGWTCFAAAEPEASPRCQLSSDGGRTLLNGSKSWIAGAGCVDHLVVMVGERDTCEFVGVDRSAAGVSIELPRKPSFLADMSQGVARFDRVVIAPENRIQQPQRARRFRTAEPLFVLIALNACLAEQARSARVPAVAEAAEAAVAQGRTLSGMIEERADFKAALSSYRESITRVVSDFERSVLPLTPPALQASWKADGRLLVMFGVAQAMVQSP